jgi:nickel-dependent lactate racemase
VNDLLPEAAGDELGRRALGAPVGAPRGAELARGKKRIVVITSDHTRPLPSRVTLPPLLEELRRGSGCGDGEITLLIATGTHRPMTREEQVARFGEETLRRVRVVMHEATAEEEMVSIGRLPSGGPCEINRIAAEADLLVAEGFIEPHFFAGFSGGRKSVLPGIASRSCVLGNHCAEFIGHPKARTGILEGNPLQTDMLFAGEAARLAFVLNVVLDRDHHVVAAFAGHRVKAHRAGCAFLRDLAGVTAAPAPVVVTSNGGYPWIRTSTSREGHDGRRGACIPGGVIVMCAECRDGNGGERFVGEFRNASGPEDVLARIGARKRDETLPDQWESQVLARVLSRHAVVLVTEEKNFADARTLGLIPAATLEEAMARAEARMGVAAPVLVLPDGVAVIVEPAGTPERPTEGTFVA